MNNTSPPRFIKYMALAFAALAALLILFVNGNLAALAEWLLPGSLLWAHGALLAVEGLALTWFWRGLFRRRKHLLLLPGDDEQDPDGRARFARELARRLADNRHVRQAGLRAATPGREEEDAQFVEHCLVVLNDKADAEIRQTARRIFLATSLSQNGRLDALIVFVSLCRLVWRVSGIYNQRPHPREVASLYWAVVTSTFLALSFEELDIATEVSVGFGEAFHAMAPAGVTAGIPFAGKALQTFTTAVIDGTANCYLALRAGIIVRNAYAYGAKGMERPGRAPVFREAGGMLLSMSRALADRVAETLARGMADAARAAGGKTLKAGKELVGGIGRMGQELGASAGQAAAGAVSAVQDKGKSIRKAGSTAGHAVGGAVTGTVTGVVEGVAGVSQAVTGAVGGAVRQVAGAASSAAMGTVDAAGGLGRGVARAGRRTGTILGRAARKGAATGKDALLLPLRPFRPKNKK